LAGAFTYHAGGGSGGSLSMILGSLKGHGTALSNGGVDKKYSFLYTTIFIYYNFYRCSFF
jgi:hypothetical protein